MKTFRHATASVAMAGVLLATTVGHAAARHQSEPVQLYDDPRVLSWSKDYLAGEAELVLQSVEADLRSAGPHPFAPLVWAIIHLRHNRLAQVWSELEDPGLRDALQDIAEVVLLREQNRHRELLGRYPPETAEQITDVGMLVELAASATTLARRDDSLAYLLVAAGLYPMHFQVARRLEDAIRTDDHRNRVQDAIEAGEALHGTPVAAYLSSFLAIRPWRDLDRLAVVDDWLATCPLDAYALRTRGDTLADQRYDEEAADVYLASIDAFPFQYPAVAGRARVLLRGNGKSEAEALFEQAAVWYASSTEEQEIWSQLRLARALRDTGDKGEARRLLERALERWPRSAGLLGERAELERADGREEEAATYARRAWEQEPDSLSRQLVLLQSLQEAGELEEALMRFEQFDGAAAFRSRELYSRGAQILGDLGQSQTRIALLERALADFPDSVWMHGSLAEALSEAGRPQDAWEILRRALDLNPEYNWGVGRIARYVTAADGEVAAVERIRGRIDRQPWQEALWSQLEDLTAGDVIARRLAVWREAMSLNPGQTWPVRELTNILVAEERWEEAFQAAHTLFTAEPGSSYATIMRHHERASIVGLAARVGRGEPADVQRALADLDTFKAGYGWLGAYHREREAILLTLGRKMEAALNRQARARLYPDDIEVYHGLVAQYTRELGDGNTIGHGKLIVDRNPYDGPKLAAVARRHVQWAGSPIVALSILEQMKRRGVYSSEYDWMESRALGQLGDAVAQFEGEYSRRASIGSGERYVGWYDSARNGALMKPRFHVRIDYDAEMPTAEIALPTKEVVRRVDHPRTGRVMSVSKGDAFLEAVYDPAGELLIEIRASSGAKVAIEYDDTRRIIRINDSERGEFRYAYNLQGKVVEMVGSGLGAIRIEYDDDDSVASVETVDEAGRRGGAGLALELSRTMREFLQLAERLGAVRDDVTLLSHDDERRDQLRNAYEELVGPGDAGRRAEAGLVLARYLVKRLHVAAEYGSEAREVLDALIETGQARQDLDSRAIVAEAMALWYRLARATKPKGLPGPEYGQWSAMREWLGAQAEVDGDRFAKWFAEITATPLELFPDQMWLPKSELQNPGFWRRYANKSIFPDTTREPRATVGIVRKNGDVVFGHSAGLSVLRRGFWEWFGFDERAGRFSATASVRDLGIASEVLSLAETVDGVLWVGTGRGLYALDGEYDGSVRRWRTEEDGLPSPRIEHLTALGEQVVIGTGVGLRRARLAGLVVPVTWLSDVSIRFVVATGRKQEVLVGTDRGLYAWTLGNQPQQLTPWSADDAAWVPFLQEIVVLQGTDIYRIKWKEGEEPGEAALLFGQQDIRYSRQIYGLRMVQVPEGASGTEAALAVLTDEGISLYRDWHFESMPLPLAEQRLGLNVGPRAVATGHGDMYFLTQEGLYAFERGHVKWMTDFRVHDLVADHDAGLVYVARGERIDVVDEEDPELESYILGRYQATQVALDGEGHLVANDGYTIIRFEGGGSSVGRELFRVRPTTREQFGHGPVRDLLVRSDGTVWVAAGGSVFRWNNGATEEFSFLVDQERFPSRTDMIARVIETIEGKIWVVASNEGHRAYQGIPLGGGLLEWTGEDFRRIGEPEGYRMITGYTAVEEDLAIVGSTSGFYRHTADGRYEAFGSLGDASYRRLQERNPLVWLGGEGARLEGRSWLFPSAGGVLLFHNGRWLYPERLNQMLPGDQEFGQYGARTVHAVTVDGRGRIYAGTDLGLAIYEAGGSAASLLADNGLSAEAFGDSEVEHLRRLGEIMLEEVDPDSDPGRVLARYGRAEREISELERELDGEDERFVIGGPETRGEESADRVAEDPESRSARRAELLGRLENRERARQRLLLQLENEHHGLFQMLRLDPRELSALHTELAAGQTVVQYLPTPDKLLIQLVSHEGAEYREVDVTEEELYRRAREVALALAGLYGKADSLEELERGGWLASELSWLYDQLLRPVERELASMEQVFVVPVGALTYLPFSALIYRLDDGPRYAVERFAMGSLPSLFHLQLVLKHRASYVEENLLVGDPDGTLPAAREEVREISAILPGALPPLVGEDATLENFQEQAPYSRIVHLATHGALDERRPAESYLLMADGYRLNMTDISLLELEETDLVVLSACESGIGADGLEYAHMARAFAHARVPTVIASLGQVNDAATRQLMTGFYSEYVKAGDAFLAMSAAQQAMIKTEEWGHPAAWSGFLVFGRP